MINNQYNTYFRNELKTILTNSQAHLWYLVDNKDFNQIDAILEIRKQQFSNLEKKI